MHFVTKYLSGLKKTVSADSRVPLIIYHLGEEGGNEGSWGEKILWFQEEGRGGSVVTDIRMKQKQFINGSF